jgi:hypothetical protein
MHRNRGLGAVYTCDLTYESAYDSVYDFLHKVQSDYISEPNPKSFVCKLCTESYSDGIRNRTRWYAESDTCRWPFSNSLSRWKPACVTLLSEWPLVLWQWDRGCASGALCLKTRGRRPRPPGNDTILKSIQKRSFIHFFLFFFHIPAYCILGRPRSVFTIFKWHACTCT